MVAAAALPAMHWRRVLLKILVQAAALQRLLVSQAAGLQDKGHQALAYAGQTVRRRPKWSGMLGLSRKSKQQLHELCVKYGIEYDNQETSEDLRTKLYNYYPPERTEDLEGHGSRRRTANPNLPGLARLSKAQL